MELTCKPWPPQCKAAIGKNRNMSFVSTFGGLLNFVSQAGTKNKMPLASWTHDAAHGYGNLFSITLFWTLKAALKAYQSPKKPSSGATRAIVCCSSSMDTALKGGALTAVVRASSVAVDRGRMRRCIKRWATENREASPRHLPGGCRPLARTAREHRMVAGSRQRSSVSARRSLGETRL